MDKIRPEQSSHQSSRACPVCDGNSRQLLYRQNFHQGLLGDYYNIVVCLDCGTAFADEIPSQTHLNQYYAKQSKYIYDYSGGAESHYDLQRFEVIADQIAPYISRRARILDIGCATGGLLSVLKQRGFTNILGADPSPGCAAAGRKLYEIEIRCATLDEVGTWPDQFDLILMVGVLEHLREARKPLKILADRIVPGGFLFVAVPDVQMLVSCTNAPFQQFSMEHVNFFSSLSLNRLIENSGFELRRNYSNIVEWREAVTEPVLAGIYQRGHSTNSLFDTISETALREYIKISDQQDEMASDKINEIVAGREPVLIWGAGALTRRLLACTSLSRANIVAFIDSSERRQSELLANRKVFSPSQIVGRKEPIIICSVAFEQEILKTIKQDLLLDNKIISLYL